MDMYRKIHGKNDCDQTIVTEREEEALGRRERLQAMIPPLLDWYGINARALPWRERPEPYRVWISEIMLQQTRVEAVKPYFKRFMAELPTVSSLAKVTEEKLFKLWEGLGYYTRARNLKKAAQIIEAEYNGRLPADYQKLLSLPGIGSYTAGAIASMAYGLAVPAVDGNVLRVVSRLLADSRDIRKASVKAEVERELAQVIPRDHAGSFNQGLIEVGALVCVPGGEPQCGRCPLSRLCLTCETGAWREIPYRSPLKARRIEERTVCVLCYRDRVAICKRPDEGLLASLYELPSVSGILEAGEAIEKMGLGAGQVEGIEALPRAKHVFSHVEWHMIGYRITLNGPVPKPYLMVDIQELNREYPLPGAFNAYKKLIFMEKYT